MRSTNAVISALLAIVASGTPSRGDGPDLEAKWRREYPEAAARLERQARDFVAIGRGMLQWATGRHSTTDVIKVTGRGDDKIIQSDGRVQKSPDGRIRNEPSRVTCSTNKHEFTLTRDGTESPYTIKGYGPRSSPSSDGDEDDLDFWFSRYTQCATRFGGETLLERLQSPSFTVRSMTVDPPDGEGLVRLDYEYQSERNKCTESGVVDLNPSRSWAIQRVDIVKDFASGRSMVVEVDLDYAGTPEGCSVPSRTEYFQGVKGRPGREHFHVEFHTITPGPPPDDMFRLTGYGLPDVPLEAKAPGPAARPSTPLLWTALAVSLTCLCLLAVLRRREASLSL